MNLWLIFFLSFAASVVFGFVDALIRDVPRVRRELARLCICGHTFGEHRARPPGEPSGCKYQDWTDHGCTCPDFRAVDAGRDSKEDT